MKYLFRTTLAFLFAASLFAQSAKNPPYLNPDLSPEKRAQDLVSRMTLEEKVLQMQNVAPAIPRLKVPAYNWWSEALHGVVGAGQATVFPQAIGLAATWDTHLMHQVSTIISTEARARWNEAIRSGEKPAMRSGPGRVGLTFWSPNINIFRDPRWGRGQETYGEDPYLAGQMAVQFVRGMQGDNPHYLKTVSTPKHYVVHSGPEPLRHQFDARVSEYDLTHTYLPAFRAAIVEGKADSIMCAYSAVNGVPACANTDLLQKRLRDEWGFQGYVVSDCGAIRDIFSGHKYAPTLGAASADAVKAGTDLTCGQEYKSLIDEVKSGRFPESEINRAVERLFVARFRLGMFDPPDRVPYSKIPFSEVDSAAHRKVALQAEREAIVLLKNQDHTLPLASSVTKIAVVGPSADDAVALLGNYHGISSKQVTPLEGIRTRFAGKAQVSYAVGSTYTSGSLVDVPSKVLTPSSGSGHGVNAEYFDNTDFQGQPVLRRVEPGIHLESFFRVRDKALAPILGKPFSVRWTGTLTAPYTGEYAVSARGLFAFRRGAVAHVFLDNKELDMGPLARPMNGPPAPESRHAGEAHVQLEAGHKYTLRVEYSQKQRSFGAQLVWNPPAQPMLDEAVKAIKNADVAIVCVGLNSRLEGEEMRGLDIPGFKGGDRTRLTLPEPQDALVKAAVATGKPVVVVLTSGSAIAANFSTQHAGALLEAWYGGEELGTALAETLAGDNNPAGRLPVTFYKSVTQLPPFTDYAMKGRTYRYFHGDPLYTFGYGLSYSTFQYSGLHVQRTAMGAEISARVKNTSSREGDEVAELYLSGSGGPDGLIRQLSGFQRIHLGPQESREVKFTVKSADLPPGSVTVSVGGGQPLAGIPHVEGKL
jgi:beta-glucosidase